MDPVVAEYLREKADALRRHEAGVRADAPGSIHRARVAVRKIRSALRIFVPDSPESRSLEQRFQDWGHLLGAARDAEVMRELLAERVSRGADDDASAAAVDLAARLDHRLAEDRERARRAVVGQLDSPEHAALRTDLAELITPAPAPHGERAKALVSAARSAHEKYRRRAHDAGQRSGADADAAWHRARRAAKRARYAAELVAGAVPGKQGQKAGEQARRLKKAQSRLGEHQDEVTLRAWLEQQRGDAADEDTAAFDALLRPGTA